MKSHSNSLRRSQPLLGTLVDITVTGDRDTRLARALEDGFRAVAEVHRLMSFHEPESDVSRLNREALHHAAEVDARTWTVLDAARRVSEASDGSFDVTVASLLVKWGLLPATRNHDSIDATTCWRDIELLDGNRIRFAQPLLIDLGGIAKGFAVDQAIEVLRASGVETACVNAGGDLRVYGSAAEPLYVRHPQFKGRLIDAGRLRDEAAATSSDTDTRERRSAGWIGQHVHPGTRRACDGFASVTVRASSCMLADALTKVVLCDPERAVEVLAQFSASALAVDRNGEVCITRPHFIAAACIPA